MEAIWILSIFWVIYGILGIFGIQLTPAEHRNKPWTKQLARDNGISWLALGLPWLAICLLTRGSGLDRYDIRWYLIAAAVPTFVLNFRINRKYHRLLDEFNETQSGAH